MSEIRSKSGIVTTLVVARLMFSGALVGLAVAGILGLNTGETSQFVAGAIGAAAVGALKKMHLF